MDKSVNLILDGHVYNCQSHETVLDALLRQKIPVPYSCKKQTCLECMMRSLNNTPPIRSQRELKESLQLQNYFLACACYPLKDMELVRRDDVQASQIVARVCEKNCLHPNIIELVLESQTPLTFFGGQTVLLFNTKHLSRKLPIASPSSAANNRRLEVHVERFNNDAFSKWVHESLAINDLVYLSHIRGELLYTPGQPQQGLLMVSWNSNLAAMLGLLQDAFEQGHQGPVVLFHGVAESAQLYLQAELQDICSHFPNFRYFPCIEQSSDSPSGLQSTVDQAMLRLLPNLAGWKVFVCGNQRQVSTVQRLAYLAKAAMKDIYIEVVSL